MRFVNYIEEEYKGIYPGAYGYDNVTVFVNPSKKEMIEAMKEGNLQNDKEVRFIIDLKNKNLYIWNAWAKVHQPMARQLGLSDNIYASDYIFGNAKVINGKLGGLDNMHYQVNKHNYDWIGSYFDKKSVEILLKAEY
jgi:hypothetical protein